MVSLPCAVALILLLIRYKGYRMSYNTINGTAIIVFSSILFLLLALRFKTVGVDTLNYLDKYHKIGFDSFSSIWSGRRTVDIGYGLLNKLLATMGLSDRMFLSVIALLMTAPVAWLYVNESDNWMLTVSLFIILPDFSMMFTGMRQGLSMALVPFMYYFSKKHNIIGFLISVFIAFSLHSSAIFMLIMYPIFNIKIKNTWLIGLIPIMTLGFIFNKQLYSISVKMLGGKFEERYSDVSGTGAYTMLILFILMAVFSFIITDENKMDPDDFGMRNLLVLIVALQFFAPVNSVAMRLNYFFLILLPVIMPRMIACSKDKYRKLSEITQYVMVVFFTAYFFVKGSRANDSFDVFPYRPWWRGW